MWPLLQISCLKKHKCYSSSTKDCICIQMRRGKNFEVFDQVLESETCLETCSALLVVIKPGFFPMTTMLNTTTIFSTSHLSHPHHGCYHPSPLWVRSCVLCSDLSDYCMIMIQWKWMVTWGHMTDPWCTLTSRWWLEDDWFLVLIVVVLVSD